MTLVWTREHEGYLKDLKATCEQLSSLHREGFRVLKKKLRLFKIPSIIVGSVSSMFSFGTGTFPASFQSSVSILVGATSLTIAILQSIEAFLKISERMAGHLASVQGYSKLAEDIHLETSLSPDDRSNQGIAFVRDVYDRYEKLNDGAPYLHQAVLLIAKQARGESMDAFQKNKFGSRMFYQEKPVEKRPVQTSMGGFEESVVGENNA